MTYLNISTINSHISKRLDDHDTRLTILEERVEDIDKTGNPDIESFYAEFTNHKRRSKNVILYDILEDFIKSTEDHLIADKQAVTKILSSITTTNTDK